MARKNTADIAKAKAGKQKKIAIGLGCVLALAMAYAVHTMMALGGDKSGLPQAAGVTTPGTTTPAPAATTAAPPAAPTLSGAPVPSESSSSSSQLVSAVRPPADTGQLQSFSRFESKDPFNASGPNSSTPSSSSGSGSGSSGSSSGSSGGGGSGSATPPKTPPAPPAAPTPAPTTAVISINGVSESVTSGGAFPAANPLFQLISLTTRSAKVSVVGGSYASGSQALTLTVSKPVTLQNTADGTRYTLVLMPQGTVATAAPAGTVTPPASSTPPPVSTPSNGTTTTTGG